LNRAPEIRALIFDLDGTLLDSLRDLAHSMNDALRSLSFSAHPLAAYCDFVGDGAQQLALRATPAHWRHDPIAVSAVYEKYLDCYSRRWDFESTPFDGIPELLDQCVAREIKIAVLSNKIDLFTQQVVSTLLPRWPWAAIRGQRPDTPRKPAPDGALALAAQLELPCEACAFLGDSGVDMACAKSAGMPALGALWGYRLREEMAAAGADFFVAHPSEVLPWLQRRAV